MITIGIKALNEEQHIERALRAALDAVAPYSGEVILADSGSTDETVAIAQKFPVRIVQLVNPRDRCCGAGAQLAFQFVNTPLFYLQDGDMHIDGAFFAQAIKYLEANPTVAGVGGHVVEAVIQGEEFEIRARSMQHELHRRAGPVDRLDGGGLYRVAAIKDAGYFAGRNLHAFEEFDLAARLNACGWKLARIDCLAVRHFGHAIGGYRLMWRRIQSGYTSGVGEVLRAAIGKSHYRFVMYRLRHVQHAVAVIIWWMLVAAAAAFMPWLLAILFGAPIAVLSARRGTLRLGVYSAVYWNAMAYGLIRGLCARRTPPGMELEAISLGLSP